MPAPAITTVPIVSVAAMRLPSLVRVPVIHGRIPGFHCLCGVQVRTGERRQQRVVGRWVTRIAASDLPDGRHRPSQARPQWNARRAADAYLTSILARIAPPRLGEQIALACLA